LRLSKLLEELNLKANGDIEVVGLNTLRDAKANEISFLDNPRYIHLLKSTEAGAVFLDKKYIDELNPNSIPIVTDEPYLNLAKSSKFFAKALIQSNGAKPKIGKESVIMENSYIGKDVKIGERVTIMAGSFIGDGVEIGDDTILYPNSVIYRDCKVGDRVIIHSNTVIGSDGFGFAHTKDGKHIKIYQNGNVSIGDDVEVGSNCSIDRAVFGSTIIESGTKIDNLVQIAHNVRVGEDCLIAGQVGISGSTTLERGVIMGGQSATVGHIKVGSFSTIAARSGVTKSLKGGKTYAGFPIFEHREWLKLQSKISKLRKE
jgi:UDP-3-O-[3-hydroxymyristoyl] glucosamine N-acyltransferase